MKIKGEKKVKKILDLIADEMKSAFTACGYDASYARVVLSLSLIHIWFPHGSRLFFTVYVTVHYLPGYMLFYF